MRLEDISVFWFTGQPGAGKTELGNRMLNHLGTRRPEQKYVIVDGDDIREMFDNQDYSIDGRKKNVEFVQKLCLFLNKNGIVPIVCMVSPFSGQRETLKKQLNVAEIYVSCSEIRGREAYHVDYYEKPETDFFAIDTTGKEVSESFAELLKTLEK